MALITEMDKYAVFQIDKGLRTCTTKLNSDKYNEGTKRKLQRLHDKYTAQKAKTIRLYNRNKHKNKALKSMSVSTLSVAKILDVLGKNTTEIGPVANFFVEHAAENSVAITGATMAIIGALSLEDGALAEVIIENAKTLVTDYLFATPAAGCLTIGVALLAGVAVKKAIRKSMNESTIHRHEAEEAMNRGTFRDVDKIVNDPGDLIIEAAAGKSKLNATYQHLASIANNKHNDPKLIAAATHILVEADKQRAEAEIKSQKAAFIGSLSSGSNKEAMIRALKLQKLKDLHTASTSMSDDAAFKAIDSTLDTTKDVGKELLEFSTDETKRKTIAATCKTFDDFKKKIIGTIAAGSNTEKAAKAVFDKIMAEHQLMDMQAAGEYKTSASGGVTTFTICEGSDDYPESQITKDKEEALSRAAHKAGLNLPGKTEKDIAKAATLLHETEIQQVNNNLEAELKAAGYTM